MDYWTGRPMDLIGTKCGMWANMGELKNTRSQMILLLVSIFITLPKRTGQYFSSLLDGVLMPEGPGPTEVPANYLKILVLQVGVLSTAQVLLTHVDTTTFPCNLFPLCITHWPQKSHKLFASRRLKQLT